MLKNGIIYSASLPWTFDVAGAAGSEIVDRSGRKLIDFTSGWNVANLGWNPPALIDAAVDQLRAQAYTPIWTAAQAQVDLARELTSMLPAPLSAVGRSTGGTEANEEAIKTARAYTGRQRILGFLGTYHGQSLATLAIGIRTHDMGPIGALPDGFSQLDFPESCGATDDTRVLARFGECLDAALATKQVAAVIVESGIVTGTGCVRIAPAGFLRLLRETTSRYGTLLILDEVGTGLSRCGWLFAFEREGIVPDVVTLGKALTNGIVPMGAMVTTPDIAEATSDSTELTSTFGWTPAACAVAHASLRTHREQRLWIAAAEHGSRLVSRLRDELSSCPSISFVRGLGLEIGIGFHAGASRSGATGQAVVDRARELGLHIVGDRGQHIQLMPPLTTPPAMLDRGADLLVQAIRQVVH